MSSRSLSCPSCGGSITLISAGTLVVCCPYCASVVKIGAEAVEAYGKMALLMDQPSCLAVGWPAKLLKRDIVTLGRVQYQYDSGIWDEWFIQVRDDLSTGWISQDEGEFMMELPLKGKVDLPDFDSLDPGAKVNLKGLDFFVEEKNSAKMIGAQGQLPFAIEPGEVISYVDLSDGVRKATIEYCNDGVQVYIGRYLRSSDLIAQKAPVNWS